MFRLKNVEGDVHGENIKLSYVGNDLSKIEKVPRGKKESRKKYDANRLAQKFSVEWKKGRGWLKMRIGHFCLNLLNKCSRY